MEGNCEKKNTFFNNLLTTYLIFSQLIQNVILQLLDNCICKKRVIMKDRLKLYSENSIKRMHRKSTIYRSVRCIGRIASFKVNRSKTIGVECLRMLLGIPFSGHFCAVCFITFVMVWFGPPAFAERSLDNKEY